MLDGSKDGRQAVSEKDGQARLTAEREAQIGGLERLLADTTQREHEMRC